jgi:hypothetical protein
VIITPAQRIPIILAGKGGGKLKTGRYLRYSKNQELGRLHLSLLQKFGVDSESFANSSAPLPGLDGGEFDEFQERPFKSWVKFGQGKLTVQGRLRMSDNLDEAKVFYIDVKGKESVRIEVSFKDFPRIQPGLPRRHADYPEREHQRAKWPGRADQSDRAEITFRKE